MYRIISIFVIMLGFLGSFNTKAQDPDYSLELVAKAGNHSFNIFDNSYSIVPAAGMEILMEEEDANSAMVNDLLDLAYSFMGTHYRRGGKSPAGFDCSGFTHYIFKQFGFNLNADSRSQYLQGEKINTDEIIPGDLLFFSGSRGGSTVGHVGIAVENDLETGEITFIHSAIGGGIRIDTTTAPYYSRRYLGARRIIGIED